MTSRSTSRCRTHRITRPEEDQPGDRQRLADEPVGRLARPLLLGPVVDQVADRLVVAQHGYAREPTWPQYVYSPDRSAISWRPVTTAVARARWPPSPCPLWRARRRCGPARDGAWNDSVRSTCCPAVRRVPAAAVRADHRSRSTCPALTAASGSRRVRPPAEDQWFGGPRKGTAELTGSGPEEPRQVAQVAVGELQHRGALGSERATRSIDEAIRRAEQVSRYEFCVFVGPAEGDPRAFATRLHNSLVAPARSILIMVDPARGCSRSSPAATCAATSATARSSWRSLQMQSRSPPATWSAASTAASRCSPTTPAHPRRPPTPGRRLEQ